MKKLVERFLPQVDGSEHGKCSSDSPCPFTILVSHDICFFTRIGEWRDVYEEYKKIEKNLEFFTRFYDDLSDWKAKVPTGELTNIQGQLWRLEKLMLKTAHKRKEEAGSAGGKSSQDRNDCFRYVEEAWLKLSYLKDPMDAVFLDSSKENVKPQIKSFRDALFAVMRACEELNAFQRMKLELGSQQGIKLFGKNAKQPMEALLNHFDSQILGYLAEVGLCRKSDFNASIGTVKTEAAA